MSTYYIDPSASVNGDGSEVSPFNTWASVEFAEGNEYLQRTGTTYSGMVTVSAANVKVGHYGPETIPSVNGLLVDRPKINANGFNRGFVVGVDAHNVVIDSFEVYGANSRAAGTVRGIAIGSTTTNRADNCTLLNVIVRDINSGALTDDENGIQCFGNNLTILDSEVYNIADDGILVSGNNLHIGRTHVHHVAQSERIAGDCIQLASNVGFGNDYWIHDCILDHSNIEMKQCFIDAAGSGATGATGGIFERNTCIMGADNFQDNTSKTINVKNAGAIVRNCWIEGGWSAAWLDGGVLFCDNLVKGYKNTGVNLYSLSNGIGVINNTFDGSRVDRLGTQRAINIATDTVSCQIYNNVGVNNLSGIVCYKTGAASNGIDILNNCFNGGTPYTVNGGIPESNITSNPLLDADYMPQAGSPCIGSGYKYWANGPRPTALNGEARPDKYGDVGCYQSKDHPFHPTNLRSANS